MGSSQGRKRALDSVGAVLMQWAMYKDKQKQQLEQKIAMEDAAKEKAKLMLEKRKQDMEWDIKKMDYKNSLDDADRAEARTYAEKQATKEADVMKLLEAQKKKELEADNAKIGTVKSITGRNDAELVYKGAGKWDYQKKEGLPGVPQDELIRMHKYRDTLPPGDPRREEVNSRISKITMNAPNLSKGGLTKAALAGDPDAKLILDTMAADAVKQAEAMGKASSKGKIAGLAATMDLDATAHSIVLGKETLSNVKNTFGVPIQEVVRQKVLDIDPEFNFIKPRVTEGAVKSTLVQQTKQRGMMGSFVKNLNNQVARVDTVMKDVISRFGARFIDLPIRELKTRAKGSGHEQVVEAYMLEISNEIGKLSTGSVGSVRELSTEAQERWAKIHDPNLSLKQLKIILEETKLMGNMRLTSTDDEIAETLSILDNINEPTRIPQNTPQPQPKSRFKILGIE
uniref:Uncharacterized protein n=1 Tax=viral metagenome TaxID=1070528 RepID=A0A6M3J097_9ZZZZ